MLAITKITASNQSLGNLSFTTETATPHYPPVAPQRIAQKQPSATIRQSQQRHAIAHHRAAGKGNEVKAVVVKGPPDGVRFKYGCHKFQQ